MKTYWCSVPIAGYVNVKIEADDEATAKDLAFKKASESMGGVKLRPEVEADANVELCELDARRWIVKGNVCDVPLREIDAEEFTDG